MNTRFVRRTSRQMTTIIASLGDRGFFSHSSQASQQPPYHIRTRAEGPFPSPSRKTTTPFPRPWVGSWTRPRPCTAPSTPWRMSRATRDGLRQAGLHVPDSTRLLAPRTCPHLTHGWWGTRQARGRGRAGRRQAGGFRRVSPTIVARDSIIRRSFVPTNYEDDYTLNHCDNRSTRWISILESRWPRRLRAVIRPRLAAGLRAGTASGGFSMGATTTWDVLALRPQYFYGYMPMAGES